MTRSLEMKTLITTLEKHCFGSLYLSGLVVMLINVEDYEVIDHRNCVKD